MKNGNGHAAVGVFGSPDRVMVRRGLAEFRASRPVIVSSAASNFLLALPVDPINPARLSAFTTLCAPREPKLVVTAPRAHVLGIETSGPVVLSLPPDTTAPMISSLVADADPEPVTFPAVVPADACAAAAVDLAKYAYRLPALLVAGTASASHPLAEPALVCVPAEAIATFREDTIRTLEIAGAANVPLHGGIAARFVVFRDTVGGTPAAIIVGKPDVTKPVPVRLHSACLTGDVFGSRRCDCGDQLRLALTELNEQGGGIILYLEQEGRGLGLANKMRAYALQDEGLDTVDANTTLGFDDDERDYRVAARMLEMLGCSRVLLMTNNPLKLDGLSGAGIEIVGRKSLQTPINAHNRRYLTAKAMRAGHKLDHLTGALDEISDKRDAVPAE